MGAAGRAVPLHPRRAGDARLGVRPGGRPAARRPRRPDADARLGAGRGRRLAVRAADRRRRASCYPAYMDSLIVFGFVAAVLGGLDSPVGAIVGGLIARPGAVATSAATSGSALVNVAALVILMVVLLVRPRRPVRQQPPPGGHDDDRSQTPTAGADAATRRRRSRPPRPRTRRRPRPPAAALVPRRSPRCCGTCVVAAARAVGAVILLEITEPVPQLPARHADLLRDRGGRPHRADRAERPDLARPRRADGRRRLHDRRCSSGRSGEGALPLPLILLVAACCHRPLVGALVGVAAARLHGPYLAGATLALAVGLPGLAIYFDAHARRRAGPAGRARPQAPELFDELHRLRLRQLDDRHQVAGLRRHDAACCSPSSCWPT